MALRRSVLQVRVVNKTSNIDGKKKKKKENTDRMSGGEL